MIELRAVIVCVDFHDYLKSTLPWNRHHFREVMVITSRKDLITMGIALRNNCRVFRTDSFYDDGAIFNKWKALEEGLDRFGRSGWITLLDSDTCWPRQIDKDFFKIGNIYSPYRRMCPDYTIPDPDKWAKYPRHKYSKPHDLSGYSMIFHADDPHLGKPPWHEINWKHAGGADTFFQKKWMPQNRIRPNWEVIHLGEPGQWTGRTSRFQDGEYPKERGLRQDAMRRFMTTRRHTKKYDHEKLT